MTGYVRSRLTRLSEQDSEKNAIFKALAAANETSIARLQQLRDATPGRGWSSIPSPLIEWGKKAVDDYGRAGPTSDASTLSLAVRAGYSPEIPQLAPLVARASTSSNNREDLLQIRDLLIAREARIARSRMATAILALSGGRRSTAARRCATLTIDGSEDDVIVGKLQYEALVSAMHSSVGDVLNAARLAAINNYTPTEILALSQKTTRRCAGSDREHAPSPFARSISPTDSVPDIVDKALTSYSDLVVGENHDSYASKKELIASMPIIKKHNAAIALEHIPRVPFQALYDEYLSYPEGKEMPKALKEYLFEQDEGHFGSRGVISTREPDGTRANYACIYDKSASAAVHKYGFYSLVREAKEHRIPFIFFETGASKQAGYSVFGSSGADRYSVMNYIEKATTDIARKGRKVVHFLGSGHIHTHHGVCGISEMNNNAPTLAISDALSKQTMPRVVVVNVNEDNGKGLVADVHASIDEGCGGKATK